MLYTAGLEHASIESNLGFALQCRYAGLSQLRILPVLVFVDDHLAQNEEQLQSLVKLLAHHLASMRVTFDVKNLAELQFPGPGDECKLHLPNSSMPLKRAEQHYSSLASVRNGLHSCRQCTYTTTDKGRMKRHLYIHTGERPFRCHLCPAAFTQGSNLKFHIRTHTGERPFPCVHCDAAFSMRANLMRHVSRRHVKRPQRSGHM
ncbi:hypothetical protein HPB50_001462 [Hyalomma asiaticum]|uniref:Uncharacterized protein n=1 Tax=Hyalomma asiaticum TaxID=266040 RepID=A0ACB7RH56_HYAAI|nr:hypothetical protein HPB50_001462 [Hyalomma asiaticum]